LPNTDGRGCASTRSRAAHIELGFSGPSPASIEARPPAPALTREGGLFRRFREGFRYR
jgi:hypothetical protein